jgi:hypothetical protein
MKWKVESGKWKVERDKAVVRVIPATSNFKHQTSNGI